MGGLQQAALELSLSTGMGGTASNMQDTCARVSKAVFEEMNDHQVPTLFVFDGVPPGDGGPR